MTKTEFVDFYEVLEISPNANSYTIERVFRFLAKRFHPDVAGSGDMHRFSLIVEAYDTLRDPQTRAAYDVEHATQQQQAAELVGETQHVGDDASQRHRLLTLFYAQRRRNMKQPGIGIATLEQTTSCPEEVLNFHLWYFREQGLIHREESGLLAISAKGVDKIEEKLQQDKTDDRKKLEDETLHLDDRSHIPSKFTPVAGGMQGASQNTATT